MSRPLRFLGEHNSSSTTDSPNSATVDSDFVVILAALLCALICVLGLVAVARCAWLRRLRVSSISSTTTARPSAPPALASSANKGLKKKILRSLPKLAVTAESAAKFSDCAICLSELSAGDEIRVLPECGHGFHVSCIDTWLGSHSSCPSCRQILVVGTAGRCDKCGGLPATATGTSTTIPPHAHQSDSEATIKETEEHLDNTFLP